MDKLLSEQKILEAIDNLKANFTCYDSVTLDEVASHVKAIPSAESCEDAISRILNRMWNCRGKHTTSIDKVKMKQIIRDDLPSVKPQDCDTCEVGNPCLYCKHEFEEQESEEV